MTNILFLGASNAQLPAIIYAKERGLYVITADYFPESPGHKIAHEWHNISTTNKEKILQLATDLKVDAVCAYASDPAAITAAYVAVCLGLIGGGYPAVSILSNKNLFRSFLKENHFLYPSFFTSSAVEDLLAIYDGSPMVLKPVDSSGSKGVFKISNKNDLISKFDIAKNISSMGEVIMEKFITHKGPQIHGEGFVLDGKLIFILLGDQVFSHINPLAPYSTTIFAEFHQQIMTDVVKIVEKIIQKVGFITGGINIEAIRDINDDIYILEIGARSGGNYMPQLIFQASGFDLVKANIDALLGENLLPVQNNPAGNMVSQIILHATKAGIYQGLNIPSEFQNLICEQYIFIEEGRKVNQYQNSRDVIGVLILVLPDQNQYQLIKDSRVLDSWVMIN